jgi:hypothetical protein
MFPGLASALQELGNVLLSVSQTLPVSQLSLIAWAMLAAGGVLGSRNSFNTPEQSGASFSKMSIQ